MSRDIEASVEAQLDQPVVEPFYAVDLEFASGALYLWSGRGNRIINGNEYIGAGTFLKVDSIEETAEIAAKGATLTLSGIPEELLALALTEPYQGRVCRIHFGFVGEEADMAEVFTGTMDQMNIDEGAETSTIALSVENRLLDLERARVRRYTNNDQQSRFPGDKGLEFVESLQDKELFWGRTA